MTASELGLKAVVRETGEGRMRRWRVMLVARNGEAIAVSEPYVSKWNAKRYVRRFFGDSVRIVEEKP